MGFSETLNIDRGWGSAVAWESATASFLALAQEAAILERAGNYAMARLQWLNAAGVALLALDRDWCESRSLLCEKRMGGK